jgi:hypothetical protein
VIVLPHLPGDLGAVVVAIAVCWVLLLVAYFLAAAKGWR